VKLFHITTTTKGVKFHFRLLATASARKIKQFNNLKIRLRFRCFFIVSQNAKAKKYSQKQREKQRETERNKRKTKRKTISVKECGFSLKSSSFHRLTI